MLDRTRSHKFVNGDTNASSVVVVVVVICVLKVFTTIRGIFVIRLELQEEKSARNAWISLKKKYASNKSLTIFSHSFIQSAINGVVFFFPHSNTSNGKNKNPRRKLRRATPRITTDRS